MNPKINCTGSAWGKETQLQSFLLRALLDFLSVQAVISWSGLMHTATASGHLQSFQYRAKTKKPKQSNELLRPLTMSLFLCDITWWLILEQNCLSCVTVWCIKAQIRLMYKVLYWREIINIRKWACLKNVRSRKYRHLFKNEGSKKTYLIKVQIP